MPKGTKAKLMWAIATVSDPLIYVCFQYIQQFKGGSIGLTVGRDNKEPDN